MGFLDELKGKANDLKDKAKVALDESEKNSNIKKKIKNEETLSIEEKVFFEKYNKQTVEAFVIEEKNKFRPTKRTKHLIIDDDSKQWTTVKTSNKTFKYSELLSYELIEDGESVTKGGVSLGRAVVGGVLFSGVGMILGGLTGKKKSKNFVTEMKIVISVNNPDNPSIIIPLVKKKMKKDSKDYKKLAEDAQETLSYLDMIAAYEEEKISPDKKSNEKSVVEELKEYKELLDAGIIDQEDFDRKKAELL
ncbi:Short C-terminal domain-containing protein [Alkalibacterium putridalgicola]|uniref:Short C-terminal domain-containing protein n=1 Tax=Alkalibacterium putridalgicola TaxID=426703 RepID=A0A1H7RPQ7_9LACT|nr:SHOCT domain-containing protein [Alkalibacterium putridalgicola]GEK88924.1 hypothetical protein APU01nite_09630 [Alkalibacterium putridalgicola]SEL62009.1 Short C-terminal domain-containing protein [Alkalibacterium putridalgicola]